jgi:hypothetical protein
LSKALGCDPRNGLIQEQKCKNVFENVDENEALGGNFLMPMNHIGKSNVGSVDFPK